MKRAILTAMLVILAGALSGCAMTRSTLQTEDGAVMKNWAIATSGSKVTGRDLRQVYRGKTPEGYEWEAITGEGSEEISAEAEMITLLLRLLVESAGT